MSEGGPEPDDVQDVLGEGYTVRRLDLDSEAGPAVATLVRRRADGGRASRGTVLYVHGFIDYFFQTHVAERFTALGYDFYALDLRGYGRSLGEDEVPYYVTDLGVYGAELDAAWERIASDGHHDVVLMAHSTGGLITPLWLADRPQVRPRALVLNSPWLDLQESWLMRTLGTRAVYALARVRPTAVIPQALAPAYGDSIHVSGHGEWDFDTAWKPLVGVPVYAGWLAAARRGQARLHRGLDLDLPILVMHSARSLRQHDWTPEAMSADLVLDVRDMVRWQSALGPDVTDLTVPGGLHDLFLSAEPVREQVFTALEDWLNARDCEGSA